MAFIIDKAGVKQDTPIAFSVYTEARDAKLSVEQLLNRKYADHDPKYGSPFKQILASEGLAGNNNAFGLRSPTLASIMDGTSGYSAATNVERKTDPFGNQSRTLFPLAVVAAIEDQIQPDRVTDDVVFRQMSATSLPVAGDTFAQPLLNYNNVGGANTGANQARASRVTQLSQVPTMLALTTSDTYKTIPTFGVGIEMSDKALNNTSLDLFNLTLKRFFQIEKDARVYGYLTDLFAGDLDFGTSAIAAVTTTSLDSAATGGVVTHKSWVKFLARNRKKRHIDYLICDIDTYLKIESRTGRPGSNNYDPTLARIDPQLVPASPVPFGGEVRWMIVDAATDGGPVPANTVWALDSKQAFMIIENTEAAYTATEAFVLRRSESLVVHWSETVARLFPTEVLGFDVLTIA
jgi:hypothetical protein